MLAIGVVGNGFVGQAHVRGFLEHGTVKVFDALPERRTHPLAEVLQQEIVFVCLPTPMGPDGAADLSVIDGFFASIAGHNGTLVLKSTVPPGTTDRMAKAHRLPGLLHSPEFLTARAALIDFQCPARMIVGWALHGAMGHAERVRDVFRARFPGVQTLFMRAVESELVKYVCNCFFATKLSFFNEAKLVAESLDADWDKVMGGVLADGRIAKSHCFVPGPDGPAVRGFGGSCFPKDLNAFIAFARELGVDPILLQAAWDRNVAVRPDVEQPMQHKVPA